MGPKGVLAVISIAFFIGCNVRSTRSWSSFDFPPLLGWGWGPVFAPGGGIPSGSTGVLVGTIIKLQVAIGDRATPPLRMRHLHGNRDLQEGPISRSSAAIFPFHGDAAVGLCRPSFISRRSRCSCAILHSGNGGGPCLNEFWWRFDGSEGSKKALVLASRLQQTCDSDLMILTVFRHHSLLEASMSMVRPDDPENLDDAMRGYAKEVAEEAKKIATDAGAARVRAFVKGGQPARMIVKFGDEHKGGSDHCRRAAGRAMCRASCLEACRTRSPAWRKFR